MVRLRCWLVLAACVIAPALSHGTFCRDMLKDPRFLRYTENVPPSRRHSLRKRVQTYASRRPHDQQLQDLVGAALADDFVTRASLHGPREILRFLIDVSRGVKKERGFFVQASEGVVYLTSYTLLYSLLTGGEGILSSLWEEPVYWMGQAMIIALVLSHRNKVQEDMNEDWTIAKIKEIVTQDLYDNGQLLLYLRPIKGAKQGGFLFAKDRGQYYLDVVAW